MKPETATTTLPLFDLAEPSKPFRFGGETYDPALDRKRLTGQWLRAFSVMKDGQWRTLYELQYAIVLAYGKRDSEAALSARLRDFRKAAFGSHTVNRRRRGKAERGLFEYQLIVKV